MMVPSEVFEKIFQSVDRRACLGLRMADHALKTFVEMVANQASLGIHDGHFHSLHLLSDVEARSLLLEHRHDAPYMPLGPLEAICDLPTRLAQIVCHALSLPSRGGLCQARFGKPRRLRRMRCGTATTADVPGRCGRPTSSDAPC